MRKRVIISLLLLVVLLGTLVGGGKSEVKQEEKTKITWASWALAEEALRPTYMAMAEAFMRENPDIEIETVAYPYAQYKDQLIISAAAGNAPDLAHIKEEWVAPLMELDALLTLDKHLSPQVLDDFFPEIIKGVTIDGNIVCAPWFNNAYAMFYNKTLMKQAGVTELPRTWGELLVAANKISALGSDSKGNKIYGYAQPNSKTEPGVGYNFFPVMWAYGGEFIDSNGKIAIDSPNNVEAFKFVKELYENQISPNGATFKDLRNLFAQGVIGFYYDIEMAQAPINQASPKGDAFAEEYGAMVIPSSDGPLGSGYLIQHHTAIFKSVKNVDAAVKFAEFLSDKEVLQILYDAGMGKTPTRISVLDLDIFSNPDNPVASVFVDALPTARPLPTDNKNFMMADDAIADALSKLTVSRDSVEKIVKDLDKRVNELYQQD